MGGDGAHEQMEEFTQNVKDCLDNLQQNITTCMINVERKFGELTNMVTSTEHALRTEIADKTKAVLANVMDLLERSLHQEVEMAMKTTSMVNRVGSHMAEGESCSTVVPDDLKSWVIDIVQLERRARVKDSAVLRQYISEDLNNFAAELQRVVDESRKTSDLLAAVQDRCEDCEAALATSSSGAFQASDREGAQMQRPCAPPCRSPACAEKLEPLPAQSESSRCVAWTSNHAGTQALRDPARVTFSMLPASQKPSPGSTPACSEPSQNFSVGARTTHVRIGPFLQGHQPALGSPRLDHISRSTPELKCEPARQLGAAGPASTRRGQCSSGGSPEPPAAPTQARSTRHLVVPRLAIPPPGEQQQQQQQQQQHEQQHERQQQGQKNSASLVYSPRCQQKQPDHSGVPALVYSPRPHGERS